MQEINTLRADRSSFLQVKSVFQVEDEDDHHDEFITFSSEKMEKSTINSSRHKVMEPILGQTNICFEVTDKAVWTRSPGPTIRIGIAISAAPNFVRVLRINFKCSFN
jgi:hypothetical protein